MGTYVYNGKTYNEVNAEMLWSLSGHDGPMSGIAKCDGEFFFAVCHQSPFTRMYRRFFWLYPVTNGEMNAECVYRKLLIRFMRGDPGSAKRDVDFIDQRGGIDSEYRVALSKAESIESEYNKMLKDLVACEFRCISRPAYYDLARVSKVNRREYREREPVGFFRLKK